MTVEEASGLSQAHTAPLNNILFLLLATIVFLAGILMWEPKTPAEI